MLYFILKLILYIFFLFHYIFIISVLATTESEVKWHSSRDASISNIISTNSFSTSLISSSEGLTATLILSGPSLRYVTVAPARYVELISHALRDDLSNCFCQEYFDIYSNPSNNNNNNNNKEEEKPCLINILDLLPQFNGNPERLAAYFNTPSISLSTINVKNTIKINNSPRTRDSNNININTNNNSSEADSRFSLSPSCFKCFKKSIQQLTRKKENIFSFLSQREVFLHLSPSDMIQDSSPFDFFFKAKFCDAICGVGVAVAIVCILMIIITVLCTCCGRWQCFDDGNEYLAKRKRRK